MGIYDNKPRGVLLHGQHARVDKASLRGNIDFIIGYLGASSMAEERFTDHCQTAYDLGIPYGGMYRTDPELYYGSGLNPDRFPTGLDNIMIQVLEQQIMSGSDKRKVDFLIFDMTKYMDANNKTEATSNWVKEVTKHIIGEAFRRYEIPIWVYATNALVNHYKPLDPLGQLENFLTMQEEVCTWKTAFASAASDPQVIEGAWPVPPDDYKPEYVYAPNVAFFRYANSKYAVSGITDKNFNTIPVPLWMLFGSQWITIPAVHGTGTTPPPVDPGGGTTDPGTGGGTTGGTTVNMDMSSVVAALDKLTAEIKRGNDHLGA